MQKYNTLEAPEVWRTLKTTYKARARRRKGEPARAHGRGLPWGGVWVVWRQGRCLLVCLSCNKGRKRLYWLDNRTAWCRECVGLHQRVPYEDREVCRRVRQRLLCDDVDALGELPSLAEYLERVRARGWGGRRGWRLSRARYERLARRYAAARDRLADKAARTAQGIQKRSKGSTGNKGQG